MKAYHREGVRNKITEPIKIGHRVDLVRQRLGKSVTELADEMGLDRSTVTKWRTEGTAPRDLNAVAAALGVDVASFFAPSVTKALQKAA